jgi:Rab-GTPase-TBC domain
MQMDRKKTASDFRMSLHGLPYDQTTPDQAPIPITTPSSEPTAEQLQARGIAHPTYVSAKTRLQREKDGRRDSGLAGSSVRDSRTTVNTEDLSAASLKSGPSVPRTRRENELISIPSSRRGEKVWLGLKPTKSITEPAPPEDSFHGIELDIPTGDLEDDLQPEKMEFSKRGSMLIRSGRVDEPAKPSNSNLQPEPQSCRVGSNPSPRKRPAPKSLSADEELLSHKVRSYYETGMESMNDIDRKSSCNQHTSRKWHETGGSWEDVSLQSRTSDVANDHSAAGETSRQQPPRTFEREELELAGGLEDWQDVESGDVDRYGFIMPRSSTTSSTNGAGMKRSPSCRDPPTLQRISTSLQLAAEAPRRKHTIRRAPSSAHSTKSAAPGQGSTGQPMARIARPVSSQSSYQSRMSGGNSRLRQAANRLPHNRDRRFMDEAGDMLTRPFRLADIAENGESEAKEAYARRKEVEREEKWRKMARVVSSRPDGGGTRFDFDVRSTKLIERTWKGIPDRWRATAWHAFLSASAKKSEDVLADGELIEIFHQHQSGASPDDVQIDIDVPRTISSHIMFRRRYRGGQRLLFRVLHAMSLQFPSTGYVQGMAALAATLLAYFDEEIAFVMLVRLWELRGLDKLYTSGFEGLMEALDDFEKKWLNGGEISAKLVSLASESAFAQLTMFDRPTSGFLRRLTGHDGISPCSTIPSPSRLSFECGMFSCFLETRTIRPRTVLPHGPAHSAVHLMCSMPLRPR